MASTKTPTAGTRPARLSRAESRARIVAAVTELVRERSFHELSVGEVMGHADLERTIFYRHFEGLPDLLLQSSIGAVEQLFEVQVDLSNTRGDTPTLDEVRAAIEPAVSVYERNGPLLRALSEAGGADPGIKERGDAIRRRFDELVAASLARLPGLKGTDSDDLLETARALNLLNENYLRDAYGREPRISLATAVDTLSEIWLAVVSAPATRA